MNKDGTLSSINEELRIVWNSLIIFSENSTIDKGKSMFILHQTNRLERIMDELNSQIPEKTNEVKNG